MKNLSKLICLTTYDLNKEIQLVKCSTYWFDSSVYVLAKIESWKKGKEPLNLYVQTMTFITVGENTITSEK